MSKPYPPPDTKIPRALFLCSEPGCNEENSYYASDLFWHEQAKRWVCDGCWGNVCDEFRTDEDDEGKEPERGVTLAEYIHESLSGPPPL